jgi:hypothetical protein
MTPLNKTDRLRNPADVMEVSPPQRPKLPGERFIVAYLLCLHGCKDAIPLGDDQWQGHAPIACQTCAARYYINSEESLIELEG